MALRQFNPVTASLRGTVLINRSELWKGKPVKALTEGKNSTGGRNNHGRITSRFMRRRAQAGVSLRRFQAAQVRYAGDGGAAGIRSEPHGVHRAGEVPGRRAGLHHGAAAAARGRQRGGGPACDIKPGNAMPMAAIPVGTIIHNIEMKPGAGGKIARSAGTYAQLVGKDAGWAQIKLASGELRVVRAECMASIGAVSNPDNMNQKIGKAGSLALAGQASAQPWRGDEPGGSSAGRWRRAQFRRASSGDAVGQADQGLQDAQQQADGQADHPPPEQGQVRWRVPSGRVRSSTAIC